MVIDIKKPISYISNLSDVKCNCNFSSNIDIMNNDEKYIDEKNSKYDIKMTILKGKR
ncbi:MAG: hypothetical protein J5634_04430 [Bacilli bacterium]|nr:hypothetical protein [Bacilli bacterium]